MGFITNIFLSILLVNVSTAYLGADDATHFRVTLHVFSGRPSPEWNIDHTNRNFQRILDGVIGHNSTALASRLGYSGFTIDEFSDGVLRKSLDVGRCTRPDFERLLLDTVEHIPPEGYDQPLSHEVIQYVRGPLDSC